MRAGRDDFLALVTLSGTGTLTTAREQLHFTRGEVLLDLTDFTAEMDDCAFAVLRVPRQVAGDLAEEHTGLPAADLRFESIAPISASARALWSRTTAFICGQLIGSGITEISAIMAEQMTRLAARPHMVSCRRACDASGSSMTSPRPSRTKMSPRRRRSTARASRQLPILVSCCAATSTRRA